jgi:N-acetylmuramoyl-L-alanine amidase
VISLDQGNREWVVSRREALADTKKFRTLLKLGGLKGLAASEYIVSLSNGKFRHRFKAVVDPGHGIAGDPGAISTGGVMEKDEALEISKSLRDALEKEHNVEVAMTREDDKLGPSNQLQYRANLANSEAPDVFVSIHLNSVSYAGPSGMEVFYEPSPPDPSYRRLAESIADAQTVMIPLRPGDPGQEQGVKNTEPFFVLVNTSMPSALVEVGWLSTPSDLAKIQANREQIAEEIAEGVVQWYEEEQRRRTLHPGIVP